jgi:type II secretory pathway pseudopilin PulG
VSTIEIIAVAVVVLVALFFVLGLAGVRARTRHQQSSFADHVRAADEALEQARALDRGWHRETMEVAARAAIGESRPGWPFEELQLVLVDDQPGTEADRAHFIATGTDGQARVILSREGDRWVAERVE